MSNEHFTSFRDFYPYYLQEHRNGYCRLCHFVGTTGVLFILVGFIWFQNWMLLIALPFMGYGFAWVGHFIFEKNKPATFRHPLYSLIADFVMYFDILRGTVPLLGNR